MRYAALGVAAVLVLVVSALFPVRLAYEQVVGTQKIFNKNTPVSVVFGGDVMLDRSVAAWGEGRAGEVFSGIVPIFASADVRVVNLEGTITSEPSVSRYNSGILRFTFDPTFVQEVLAPLQLSAASLANNHALDFYHAGFYETQARLHLLGIEPFGHPNNISGELSAEVSVEGKRVCFVGYHELYTHEPASAVQEIKDLRDTCWRMVLFAHWGQEYEPEPTESQRAEAHAFIDAGADVIIGAHPHVVQPVETYNGKAIFYSLGNLMFDQTFSWETMHGLLVRIEFAEKQTAFELIPVELGRASVWVAEGEAKERVLTAARSTERFVLPQGE